MDQTIRAGTVTIGIKADEMEIDTDTGELEQAAAQAAAVAIQRGIRGVSGQVKAVTAARRRSDGIAGTQRWNATGKLAGSVRAERRGDGFVVTAALAPGHGDDIARDVPELDDPLTKEVDAAIEAAVDEMLGGG
jgi:hypothetical protein